MVKFADEKIKFVGRRIWMNNFGNSDICKSMYLGNNYLCLRNMLIEV